MLASKTNLYLQDGGGDSLCRPVLRPQDGPVGLVLTRERVAAIPPIARANLRQRSSSSSSHQHLRTHRRALETLKIQFFIPPLQAHGKSGRNSPLGQVHPSAYT